MENVNFNQKKTCICLTQTEFDNILKDLTGNMVVADYSSEGIEYSVNPNNDVIPESRIEEYVYEYFYTDIQKFYKKLAKYFDVSEITSIHLWIPDDYDYETLVWITYNGEKSDISDNDYEPIKIEDMPEFIGQIVDMFEDYLDNNNMPMIPNDERDADDPKNPVYIWGDDYDEISNEVEYRLREPLENGRQLTLSRKEFDEYIDDIYSGFERIIAKNPAIKISNNHKAKLKQDLIDIFEKWNVCFHRWDAEYTVTGTYETSVKAIDSAEASIKLAEIFSNEDFGALKDINGDAIIIKPIIK